MSGRVRSSLAGQSASVICGFAHNPARLASTAAATGSTVRLVKSTSPADVTGGVKTGYWESVRVSGSPSAHSLICASVYPSGLGSVRRVPISTTWSNASRSGSGNAQHRTRV